MTASWRRHDIIISLWWSKSYGTSGKWMKMVPNDVPYFSKGKCLVMIQMMMIYYDLQTLQLVMIINHHFTSWFYIISSWFPIHQRRSSLKHFSVKPRHPRHPRHHRAVGQWASKDSSRSIRTCGIQHGQKASETYV